MLKKTLIIGFCTLFSFNVFAQQNVKESETYKLNKQVYQTAMKYNDVSVAKDAIYRLIALDPSDLSLLDSLAYIYFDNRNYISSVLVSNEIMKRKPNNVGAKEIAAISYQNLGLKDKALEQYESMFLINNDISTLYQIAVIQYELKRFKEAITSINIILENKKSEELKVVHSTAQNNQQEVPMKASILNLKGMIDVENGNKEEAKKNFESALKMSPDFELPKENLKKLG